MAPTISAILLLFFFRSLGDGVYTEQQSTRGQAVYGEECAKCHGPTLNGGDGSPELTGLDFQTRWKGKTVGDLFSFIRTTMPTDDPGHLSSRQYADITAFILSTNGFPAGMTDLENDATKLADIKIEPKQ